MNMKYKKYLLFALALIAVFISSGKVAAKDVYRLYSPVTKVHLYTTDLNEYQVLGSRGWKQEGVQWTEYPRTVGKGSAEPIYRLYHPGVKRHLYTSDFNEYNVLATRGWEQEGSKIYSVPTNESIKIYRLYNPILKEHLYTRDMNEYTVLATRGWIQEGPVFNGHLPQ